VGSSEKIAEQFFLAGSFAMKIKKLNKNRNRRKENGKGKI
jgi:hypothetical protein